MKPIWCAKDPKKAFNDEMEGKGVKPANCYINITNHYALGVQFGVNDTLAIVLNDGYPRAGLLLPSAARDESLPRSLPESDGR